MSPRPSIPSQRPSTEESASDEGPTSDPRRRRLATTWPAVGAPLSLLGLLAVLLYDRRVLGPGTDLLLGWSPTPYGYLLALSGVVFVWLFLFPIANERGRTRALTTRLIADPITAGAVAYLALFAFAGGVLATATDPGPAELAHANQPPLLVPVSDHVVVECAGPVAFERCFGSLQYPLGTDSHGRSMTTVLLEGARVSLSVVFVVAMLVGPIATAVGTLAGYVGGWVDSVLMAYVDVQQTVPAFVAYIVLIYVFGRSLFLFVVVFGLLSWGGLARVVRSETLQNRSKGYVQAAEINDAGPVTVVRRHLIPNATGPVVTGVTQQTPNVLLVEAAVSFMVLTDASVPTWGHAIRAGFLNQYPFLDTWWQSTIPVVALLCTVIAFLVVGDELRDVLDPRAD